MNTEMRAKLSPLQGLLFLFVLLSIPAGIFFLTQRQSVGDVRSRAADTAFTCGSAYTDSRDSKVYGTVSAGGVCWMTKNLNYGTINSSKYCYADTESNCTSYGALYTYAQAGSACPSGWRLPTNTEWGAVNTTSGLTSIIYNHFGQYYSNAYIHLNEYGLYWSTGTYDSYYKKPTESVAIPYTGSVSQNRRLSVRCVLSDTTITPTPYQVPHCGDTCTLSPDSCPTGLVCTQQSDGSMKCRSSSCFGESDCICYKVKSTPTPTPNPSCNASCTTDADCGNAMICVNVLGTNKCRNASCYGKDNCICYEITPTPTGKPKPTAGPTKIPVRIVTATPTRVPTTTIPPIFISDTASMSAVLPTPSPLPTPIPVEPTVELAALGDAKGQVSAENFTVSGTTEPLSEVEVSISPDGVMGLVSADSTGSFRYIATQTLTKGEKQLTLTVRTAEGGESVKMQAFTVKGASNSSLPLLLGALVSAIVAAVLIIRRRQQALPPIEPPITPYQPEEPQPQQEPVAEQPQPQPEPEVQPAESQPEPETIASSLPIEETPEIPVPSVPAEGEQLPIEKTP